MPDPYDCFNRRVRSVSQGWGVGPAGFGGTAGGFGAAATGGLRAAGAAGVASPVAGGLVSAVGGAGAVGFGSAPSGGELGLISSAMNALFLFGYSDHPER